MNNGLTTHVFLDILIIVINIRDEETLTLIDQLIETYEEEMRLNKSLDSVLVMRFISLLKKLKKYPRGEEGDTSRMSEIAEFILNNKDVEEKDQLFFEGMKSIFEAAKSIQSSPDLICDKKIKIRNVLTHTKFKRWTTRMYGILNEFMSTTDLDQQGVHLSSVTNLARKVVDTLRDDIINMRNGAEERIVFSDRDSMKIALDKALASESDAQILKTGLQGLNKMLGYRGGFARGEWGIIYGLSHHFKTGLLLTIARGLAKYNDPKTMVAPGKKPLIILISLENYARNNLLWFFRTAYACTYGKKPDKSMSVDEMLDFISEFYTSLGWDFVIERYKGSEFGYDDYVNTIESYEARGYEVVAALVDYMDKMKRKSSLYDGSEDSHHALTALADGLFGYNKSKGILFISPHQFNRKMQEVADRVKTNVVKHFSSDGVQGSIGINQIADFEMYVYIEADLEKRPWLTVQRGKHRYVDDTKNADKYFAYMFDDQCGITDDVEGKKRFVRDIYTVTDNTVVEGKLEDALADIGTDF